jgi:ubiquinone/menaquinone biosynthesis C-methylase UbiE
MPESLFMGRLVEQARIQPGHRVLDLGCGTATLTLCLKQAHPEAEVVGLDADPRVLEIAREKAASAGIHIVLDQGMACALPYADDFLDHVLSSLLFHHLTREDKLRALQEALRVLRPGGGLHIADWGKAEDWRMRTAFLLVQCLDGWKTTSDNVIGMLPELLSQAGFARVRESERLRTVFGTLSLYQAQKPAG